ncbi:MAG: flavodoxin-dependent (E)-4-hydroxy-3-methylbut-2-enyl-diphosphate synthase [Oscillospiraceae bacterium]|nr:flavodoxin-dependent (E)-4-hydroxy-3-methylbut-2-enyl-diphosphate synthase [Oscillospiraceae bacterium]
MMNRKITRTVNVGGVKIGGGNPVVIQSMCNTDTRNVEETVAQILRLEEAGCEIIRVAVPDMEAAEAIAGIKKQIHIPLVSDIHFDYRLALKCIENGIDKVRINPGNIGSRERVKMVADAAKANGIPIRIGVNGGSLDKRLLKKYGGATADALVESAMEHIELLDDVNFTDIVVSIKISNVPVMLEAYRKFSEKCDIPLHIGVTESGTERMGTIKSSIGIGTLLNEGIGDTLRVSLTADPVREIYAAKDIMRVCGLRDDGIEFVSCPTCGRTEIDLIGIASAVERRLEKVDKNIKVAIMGCIVNGPGEARDADIGIAGGNGEGLIFKKGEILRKVPENAIIDELMKEIEKL